MNDTLKIDVSRPLKLLLLSDLHINFRNGGKSRQKTERLVRGAVSASMPDIIAITGDLAWCPDTELVYREFCELMDSFEIPWAFCFGNHDRDFVKDPKCLENILESSRYCLYRTGEPHAFGYGNYCIKLTDGGGNIVHALYFFDNAWVHRYDGLSGLTCGSISHNRWFRENQHRLRADGSRFCTWVFQHVPLHEYEDMWNAGGCVGAKNGKNASAKVNTGLFCTLAEDSTVKGVFCGHDHGTNYMGEYFGIKLIYARTTGCDQSKNGVVIAPCGARVLEISPDGSLSSRFFLEDGTFREDGDLPVVEDVSGDE